MSLACLFFCIEIVLGVRINLAKSELVLAEAVDDRGRLTHVLGCRGGFSAYEVRMSFLKSKFIWDGIIEEMKRQLAG